MRPRLEEGRMGTPEIIVQSLVAWTLLNRFNISGGVNLYVFYIGRLLHLA